MRSWPPSSGLLSNPVKSQNQQKQLGGTALRQANKRTIEVMGKGEDGRTATG